MSRHFVEYVWIASRRMAAKFHWMTKGVYCVFHGINPSDFVDELASPYSERLNGVSAGSGLFDPEFFAHAAPAFPNVQFHVIASGAGSPPIGRNRAPSTFATQLMQYDYVGIPAVCPHFAVGDAANRFGYQDAWLSRTAANSLSSRPLHSAERLS